MENIAILYKSNIGPGRADGMYKILVVDDEPKIVELLQIYLEMQRYEVVGAYDGAQALLLWQQNKFDMVLTDIMMPQVDGYNLVEKIRKESNIPILFLTAKTDVINRVKGLQIGADDYILKPFDPLEAVARVSVNLRRCYGYDMETDRKELICGNLKLDTNKYLLLKNGQEIELTALEYRMLQFFMENQGHVLTKNQIYEAAWEENQFPDDNSIMVAISKLRAKLQDGKYQYIHTIRGLGYRMEARHEA